MAFALKEACAKYRPHLVMIFNQICYTFQYFILEASYNQGLNPHVYVAYRYIMGGLFIFPFAFFRERKTRPKLTLCLFFEIVLLSFMGISLTMNLLFGSLNYASPTFVSSILNTIASLTFVIAVILRMEVVNVRDPRGIAKILGTLLSLAGVTIITFFKGPAFQSMNGSLVHFSNNGHHHHGHKSWTLIGPILTAATCISWSLLYIMQAATLKKYPAHLSLAAWIDCIGGTQSAVFALMLLQHKPAAWSVKLFSVSFWCVVYSGIVCSAINVLLTLWCMKEKGPVFATMFSPLGTVMVAFSAYFLLGEKLYTGSILGGAIVIVGLYLLLWGKEKDQAFIKTPVSPTLTNTDTMNPAAERNNVVEEP